MINVIEDTVNELTEEVIKDGTYAEKEEVIGVLKEAADIVKKNKDGTPDEWLDEIVKKDVEGVKEIINKVDSSLLPGYTTTVKVDNINVDLFGGDEDNLRTRAISSNTLFDVASITKFYTEIVAYNLIKMNYFKPSDKIKDLDPKFKNIDDLTIGEVMEFNVDLRTPGRIESGKTIEEAKNILYGSTPVARNDYKYTDIGMMILKEVMEDVTGVSYDKLVEKFITKPLGLNNTYLTVPDDKKIYLTGSPNTEYGYVNDPKAIAMGGYSGHAGIFASSKDLVALGSNLNKVLPERAIKDTYTPGKYILKRGYMGDTYVSTKEGFDTTEVDSLYGKKSFAVQGSTRVQLNIDSTGKNGVSTVLLNPASMSLDRARIKEAELNKERDRDHQLSLVKKINFERDGKIKSYTLIDPRKMVGIGVVEELTHQNAILSLRLRLLNKLINNMDKTYNYKKDISMNISK